MLLMLLFGMILNQYHDDDFDMKWSENNEKK